jgi:RimJ/RimL family protein N-acetyltransferase
VPQVWIFRLGKALPLRGHRPANSPRSAQRTLTRCLCYPFSVHELIADVSRWQPVPVPAPLILRGHYVTLEPLHASHADPLWQAVHAHNDLWTWLAQGPYANETVMMETLERWRQAEKAVLLAIIPVETGLAAGWASFMRAKPQHGVVEVGNVLFSPDLQRTRAATEAMYLMASHVFDTLGYRRYEWKCNALNQPSRRAAQRLGFTFEGIFRQHMVVKGRSRDTAWFSLLDHEWPARKRAFETWLNPENFDEEGFQRQSLEQFSAI